MSKEKDSGFQFFPKDNKKELRLDEAYAQLLLFGTLGFHQFYLGNKKRGYYLLITCGISHLLLIIGKKLPLISALGWKNALIVALSGYALGAPVWLWDLFTLPWQVIKKKGNVTSF